LATGNGTNDADNANFTISGTSLVAAQNLPAADYHIYLVATDAAGNESLEAFTIHVAANAPGISLIERAGAAPSIVATTDTSVSYTVTFDQVVTGVDASDFILTPTGSAAGTIAPVTGSGDTYTVTVNGLSGDGTLRLDLKSSGTGIQNGSAVNIAGGYTAGQTFTFDHTAPSAPSSAQMTAGTDTGVSNSDANTSNARPTFIGMAEANATVELYDTDGTTVLGTAAADGSGHWSIVPATLAEGAHSLTAKATDAAGNISATSAPLAVQIDTLAPSAVHLSSSSLTVSAGANAIVGNLSATDASAVSLTYAFVAGVGDTDNAAFTISGNALHVIDPSLLSVGSTESIRVLVTDPAGNSTEEALTIQVTAAPPPTGGAGGGSGTTSTIDGVFVTETPVSLPDGGTGTTIGIPVVTSSRIEQFGAAGLADIWLSRSGTDIYLLAQLPIGYGLAATGGSSHSAGNSLDELVTSIKAVTLNNASSDQSHLIENGYSFLGLLSPDKQLLVETVKPIAGAAGAAASTPLTLNGSSDQEHQVALVIDATGLPNGSAIELHNVDFAAVVGSTTITSDSAARILTGDAASQTFAIDSHGSTQVFSGSGDDVFKISEHTDASSAATASLLHGGDGSDTVVFAGNQAEYNVVEHDGYLTVATKTDPQAVSVVVNVEHLQFADTAVDVDNRPDLTLLATLYQNILGRQADMGGFDFWGTQEANNGLNMGQITLQIAKSVENEANGFALTGDAAHDVGVLYKAIFARDSDAGGLAYWSNLLEHGTISLQQAANDFVYSAEMNSYQKAPSQWDFLT
jgi:hypothetical protein